MNDNYIFTPGFGKPVFLHELVWIRANKRTIPKGFKVAHKDGNYLNNIRENLYLVPCNEGEEYVGDPQTTNDAGLGMANN